MLGWGKPFYDIRNFFIKLLHLLEIPGPRESCLNEGQGLFSHGPCVVEQDPNWNQAPMGFFF